MSNMYTKLKFTNISKKLHKEDTFFKLLHNKICSYFDADKILLYNKKNSESSFTVYLNTSNFSFNLMIYYLKDVYIKACNRYHNLRDYNIIAEYQLMSHFEKPLKIYNIEFLNSNRRNKKGA